MRFWKRKTEAEIVGFMPRSCDVDAANYLIALGQYGPNDCAIFRYAIDRDGHAHGFWYRIQVGQAN